MKITPFLWFDSQAEEAVNFYLSVFEGSKKMLVTRYGEGAPAPKGSVMTVSFVLDGQEFVALNGGPAYRFTPAVSFVVNCDSQIEVDEYWNRLSEGGKQDQCGWLTDKFGVSWQVVPKVLGTLLSDRDPVKSQRVMQAMLKMKKIDIGALWEAYGA